MTSIQAKEFYEQDEKKYDIKRNKELLIWLSNIIKKGYHSFVDIDELQKLIDNITYWYEIKYPEREMEYYEGIKSFEYKDIEPLSKAMNLRQLMYRLPNNQKFLMECDYRSVVEGIKSVYDNNNQVIAEETEISIKIIEKNKIFESYNKPHWFLIHANAKSGQVTYSFNLKEYVNINEISLEELLKIFKEKYSDILDYSELESCILDHNYDIELRNKVLQLVALNLLYSNRTIPERGYLRALKFIDEFNKEMNLELITDEIDEIIDRDYANETEWEPVKRIFVDKNGIRRSVYAYEKVKENEIISRKIKKMINPLLKK